MAWVRLGNVVGMTSNAHILKISNPLTIGCFLLLPTVYSLCLISATEVQALVRAAGLVGDEPPNL